MRTCKGCGVELPPKTWQGRDRMWCSERCRKSQYAGACVECGGPTDGTVPGRYPGRGAPERCRTCTELRNLERNEEIIKLWEDGWVELDIADKLGLRAAQVRGTISHARIRQGIPVSLHRRRDRELWGEIERRWKTGETSGQIGDALGTSRDNIAEMVGSMRRAGIEMPFHTLHPFASQQEIEEAWRDGLTYIEIEDRFGYKRGAIGGVIGRLRGRGADLPRRKPGRKAAAS